MNILLEIILLFTFIGNLVLSVFVLFKNRLRYENKILSMIGLCFAIWIFNYLLCLHFTKSSYITLLIKTNFIVMILVPYLLLYFSLVFPFELKVTTKIGVLFLLPIIILISLVPTDLLVVKAARVSWSVKVIHGKAFIYYVACYFIYTTLAFIFFLYKFRISSGLAKLQIKYVFLSFSSAFIIAFITNLILPLLGEGSLIGFGPTATLFFVGFSTYAIVKHRLLDMEVTLKRGAVYVGLATFVTGCYVLVLFISTQLFGALTGIGPLFMIILVSFVIAITIEPLRVGLDKVTDKIFFKSKYDYHKTLIELNRTINMVIKLDELLDKILNTVTSAMRVKKALYLSAEKGIDRFKVKKVVGDVPNKAGEIYLENVHPLVLWLEKNKEILITEELNGFLSSEEGEEIKKKLNQLEAAICVPIIVRDDLKGILVLSEKLSGDIFNIMDLELLSMLSYQISIAVENSRLYEEMQQKDRLAVIGKMAASLAHEIKNPLTSIKAFVQMLPQKYINPTFRKKFAEIVPYEVERLSVLSENLLNISKPSKLHFEKVNLNEIIERISIVLDNQLKKKGITLVKKLNKIPMIFADEQQLVQVFLNIVLNAIDAVTDNGRIEIKTYYNNGKFIEVAFTDNGAGVPEKDLDKIFQPFFSSKNDGTGLGLSTCKYAVEAHGGVIKVKSKIGEGTAFLVLLPVNRGGVSYEEK